MNVLDRAIAWVAPVSAVRRRVARDVLAYYEAARPDSQRKQRRETGSGNDAVLRAGAALRQQARHLEQNYDLARGVLGTLVQNTVGAQGIGIEPQPMTKGGDVHDVFAKALQQLLRDFGRCPEVTRRFDWAGTQRILCRTWMRDGEAFAQLLGGTVPYLDHRTRVPLSLEMFEADYVPLDLQSDSPMIRQGVELNAWGAATAYHVLKYNPGEVIGLAALGQTKRIIADNVLHIAVTDRIRQLRGVSIFASVMNRFDDLKDYEESERIAAKVAASMAAYIKKGAPEVYDEKLYGTTGERRHLQFRPGMVFDDLKPGEEIGTIDTSRPNPNLEHYRSGQMKAIAAGTGPSYSSIARTYDGTYSAQRQELVESWGAYAVLASEFTARIVRPVYERFVALAIASGALQVPAEIDPNTVFDAEYIPAQMPWIDPEKEAIALGLLEDRAYASGPEIVRKRGGNPIATLDQQARWRREKQERGLDSAGDGAARTREQRALLDN